MVVAHECERFAPVRPVGFLEEHIEGQQAAWAQRGRDIAESGGKRCRLQQMVERVERGNGGIVHAGHAKVGGIGNHKFRRRRVGAGDGDHFT